MAHSKQPSNARPIVTEEQRQKRLAYHREWMRAYRKKHPDKAHEAAARYIEKNVEKVRESRRRRYLANREKIILRVCEYYQKNKDAIGEKKRARRASDPQKTKAADRAAYVRYRDRDKARRAARRKELAAYMRHKRNSDPVFAVADRLRRRINQALASKGARKAAGLVDVSGCNLGELVAHIERQFLPGMSWENRRQWHIDHIVPCSAFDLTDPAQQSVAFHYTNLRPVWSSENLSKQAKIPGGQPQFFWDISHVKKAAKAVAKRKANQ